MEDNPYKARESQQEPEQDSGLQTPQPDQPIPTEQERFDEKQELAKREREGVVTPGKTGDQAALRQEDESASEPSDEEGQS